MGFWTVMGHPLSLPLAYRDGNSFKDDYSLYPYNVVGKWFAVHFFVVLRKLLSTDGLPNLLLLGLYLLFFSYTGSSIKAKESNLLLLFIHSWEAGRVDVFLPFPRILTRSRKQITSCKIRTRVDSIFLRLQLRLSLDDIEMQSKKVECSVSL